MADCQFGFDMKNFNFNKKKGGKAPPWGHYGCKLPPAVSSLDKEYLYQESNFDNHQIDLQCECKSWKSPTDMFHVQLKRLKLMLQQIFKLRSYICVSIWFLSTSSMLSSKLDFFELGFFRAVFEGWPNLGWGRPCLKWVGASRSKFTQVVSRGFLLNFFEKKYLINFSKK